MSVDFGTDSEPMHTDQRVVGVVGGDRDRVRGGRQRQRERQRRCKTQKQRQRVKPAKKTTEQKRHGQRDRQTG